MSVSKPIGDILLTLVPSALKLAWQALEAISAGDHATAARKAEEAARRQAVRLAADAALKLKAKK
jgi:O6-methylguanine-DNA--protein-cysteine methyltransferase